MAKKTGNSGDMDQLTPLAKLVVETMELHGLDDATVKERGGIAHGTLNNVRRRTEPYFILPARKTRKALALGLGVKMEVVEKAAVESLAKPDYKKSDRDVFDLADIRKLTGAQRSKAVRNLKKMLDDMGE